MTLQVQFADDYGNRQRSAHDHQRLLDGCTTVGDSERDKHGSTESAVVGQCSKPELWQRDGEHSDDAIVDADFDGNFAGDGELCCDYWGWIYDCRR